MSALGLFGENWRATVLRHGTGASSQPGVACNAAVTSRMTIGSEINLLAKVTPCPSNSPCPVARRSSAPGAISASM